MLFLSFFFAYLFVFVWTFFSPNRESDGWAKWRLALLWCYCFGARMEYLFAIMHCLFAIMHLSLAGCKIIIKFCLYLH